MGWDYSEKTKKLFMDAVHGKDGTHMGEIEDPDGFGEHGSISCGDAMRFTFKVRRHPTDPSQDAIIASRYLTFGCTSAIAASEALCRILEMRELSPIEALKVSNEDIVQYLEGLPNQKIHCSVMGAEALQAAVFNWAQKRGVDLKAHNVEIKEEDEEEGRIVCNCFTVTEPYLKRKIKELGLKTIAEVTAAVKAGGACMACHHRPGGIQDVLNDVWEAKSVEVPLIVDPLLATAQDQADSLPHAKGEFDDQILATIEQDVRPHLKRDGGDIEIVEIKGTLVYCELQGACSGCAGAQNTLKLMVEKRLREQVNAAIKVIAL